MRRSSVVTIVLGVLGLVAYLYMNSVMSGAKRRLSVSSHSRRGQGVSLFYEALERTGRKPVQVKEAVLHEKTLDGLRTFIIPAPIRTITDLEAKRIAQAVKNGTQVVVSFHTIETHARAKPLLHALGVSGQVEERPDFENGKPLSVDGLYDQVLARHGETYHFYSPLRFSTTACVEGDEIDCFYLEKKHGRGWVTVIAGLPLFSNALIGRGDNRSWAARLASGKGRVGFDEYHHFYSEKTFADLIAAPAFIVPLLGVVGIVLLYLAFGYHEDLTEESEAPPPSRSFHDFTTGLIHKAVSQGEDFAGAAEMQRHYLLRLFPERAQDIRAIGRGESGRAAAQKLLKFHRRLLQERGRL